MVRIAYVTIPRSGVPRKSNQTAKQFPSSESISIDAFSAVHAQLLTSTTWSPPQGIIDTVPSALEM